MSSVLQSLFHDEERDRIISVRFRWFIVGSVIVHLLTFAASTELDRFLPPDQPIPVLQVSFRDEPDPKPEPRPTPTVPDLEPLPAFLSPVIEILVPVKPRAEEESGRRPIVELAEANQLAPDSADYLSRFNNRTNRETVLQGEGGMGGSGEQNPDEPPSALILPPTGGSEEEYEPQAGEEPPPTATEGGAETAPEQPPSSPPLAAPPAPPPAPAPRPKAEPEPPPVASAVNPDGNHRPAPPARPTSPSPDFPLTVPPSGRAPISRRDLMLNPSELEAIEQENQKGKKPDQPIDQTGGAGSANNQTARPGRVITSNLTPGRHGSIEDLRRVSPGDLTVLNSYASKYADFYNQMKRLIFFHWSSYVNNAFYIMSEYNRDYLGPGTHDLVTVLEFTIDQQGKILDKEVAKSCGTPRADDFAMQSIRLAAPFPGVPPELLDENGRLTIKFGFCIRRQ